MVDLPSSLPQPLTRHQQQQQQQQQQNNNNEDDSSSTTSSQSNPVDQLSFVTESPPQQYHKSPKLAGHPCAAGCGHFCWAANRDLDDL